jgi:predicted alpha-1,2-mannosidase
MSSLNNNFDDSMQPNSIKSNILATAILLLMLILPLGSLLRTSAHSVAVHSGLDPASYVNPFIGTDASTTNPPIGPGATGGNVFPGAAYPHGMVQWSPDTTILPGGYLYHESTIKGFSLTHFSGRGCISYQDVPFMPIIGPIVSSPAHRNIYAASFSHNNEAASPGYYSVQLDSNIDVALTVTPRSGFGRFTYPSSRDAVMLIDVGDSASGNTDAGTGVQIVGNNQVIGSASGGHFCGKANTYTVYFAATFDHPFTAFGTWKGDTVTPSARSSDGQHSGAYLSFDTTKDPVIQVKVGLSFVSTANAQTNVDQEDHGWNFEAVQQEARAAWNEHLSAIQVTGGTLEEQQVFYTALYHTLFHPNVFSDVNGQYMGFDQKVHTASGYTQYENFPGWDMYRSLIALLALLDPRATSDMMQSLVADAEQGGGGLPRWQVANDNSGGMVGDSQDAVIATSYAFGARHFDTEAALAAMVAGASQPDIHSSHYVAREGLSDYLSNGYVSTDTLQYGSASITLEYAIDDFAIAQFAHDLDRMDIYQTYLKRSSNWQNVFNPATGYIEPRHADKTFVDNFNPMSDVGFVEGDSADYTWMVPQDLGGLFDSMGGDANAIKRLDEHFTQLNAGSSSSYAYMGNEPEFEVPWEYDAAGAPYRTQDVVRRIETQLFNNTPGGLPGNDDGGAMSSWYVFAAMGLYPEIPGVAGFFLGSPLFDSITIHLGNGNQVLITSQAVGSSADSMPYVQRLSLNGQDYEDAWVPFNAFSNGARLQMALGSSPDVAWGSKFNMA